jgi:hypothetical protein
LKALKIILLLIAIIVVGGLTFLMISSMKAPEKFLSDFREETAKISKNQDVLSYPDDILERKASLDARLAMSEDDSIGMRINLREKALYLEIKGIVLHRTPILEEKTSSFFRHLSPAEKYVLFRKPLAIQDDEANIDKDKFEIVYAPKDTVEAMARPEIVPDTVLREPILYRLYFQNGIRIQVAGVLADTVKQFWPRFRFDYNDKVKFLKGLAGSVLSKKPVPYRPTISIVIDAREAQAIYRAVPKKGKVIFEL